MTIRLTETDYKRLQGRSKARTEAAKATPASRRLRSATGLPGAHTGKSKNRRGYSYGELAFDPVEVTFWVPGVAAPWGLGRARGRVWTKPICVAWQRLVYGELNYTHAPFFGPVSLDLQFHSPGRGDLTNLVKAVEDALCGRIGGKRLPGILQDDRQVKQVGAAILNSGPPGVKVTVRKLTR